MHERYQIRASLAGPGFPRVGQQRLTAAMASLGTRAPVNSLHLLDHDMLILQSGLKSKCIAHNRNPTSIDGYQFGCHGQARHVRPCVAKTPTVSRNHVRCVKLQQLGRSLVTTSTTGRACGLQQGVTGRQNSISSQSWLKLGPSESWQQNCLCCHDESSVQASSNDKLDTPQDSQGIAARVAVAAISAYKGLISPLLPNVCRFQPTCSLYGIEAYEEFGAAKGSVLLVWRLLRCNPFRGGYQGQYDPPSWPPVGLERLFKRQ